MLEKDGPSNLASQDIKGGGGVDKLPVTTTMHNQLLFFLNLFTIQLYEMVESNLKEF